MADSAHRVIVLDRGMSELRRGLPVVVDVAGDAWLVASAESARPDVVQMLYTASGRQPDLVLASRRLASLGANASGAAFSVLKPETWASVEDYRAAGLLATDALPPGWTLAVSDDALPGAAVVQLAKFAQLAPALLIVRLSRPTGQWPRVPADWVDDYPLDLAASLQPVASAPVPLAVDEACRFVLFRAADGHTEHAAIVVGTPQPGEPTLVRLHSACFTGDLFASLKCDCGEQLRTAVHKMSRSGGGILLYLNQEGRGIGLANKLRAYGLQAQGYDTLDADARLGFEVDERRFEVAGAMLAALGVSAVRVLTNNPRKLAALEAIGLTVAGRVPLLGSVNPHNEHYLKTKASRAGHLFDPALTPFRWLRPAVAAAGSTEIG